MKKTLAFLCLIIILFSCKSGITGSSPTNTVKAFIEASKEGNLTEVKKYITRSDAGMLEIGESFLARLDSNAANEMKEKMSKEFKEKTKDAKIDVKNEKITGDSATVDVEFVNNGKTESRPFSLIKEEGQWKISLLSTGMKNSGSHQQEIQETIKNINMDSLQGVIAEGMKEINKIDKDSMKKMMKEGMKEVERLKDRKEQ
ncbi:MAG: hypothetical protein JWP81_5139 [Ferruginibacter sp.]|nr:hypothetical protein [Ferruginibacter sp.]